MFRDYLKIWPHFILPKLALTRFAGRLAQVQTPAIKNYLIQSFVKKYQVNMQEALEENIENYASFNDFFIRPLKPEARPVANTKIISPIDGTVLESGPIQKGQILQAKGRYFSVQQLLATSKETSALFDEGHFSTFYLSPKDYHRVHMPMDGQLKEAIYLPGTLFSVQPTAARTIPHLFARNERLVLLFETAAGPMALIMVAATIVGSIGTRWEGALKRRKAKQQFNVLHLNAKAQEVLKGEEIGYFKLGSTVILLFSHQNIHWEKCLKAGNSLRYGEALGHL